jgi:hypothetical protein
LVVLRGTTAGKAARPRNHQEFETLLLTTTQEGTMRGVIIVHHVDKKTIAQLVEVFMKPKLFEHDKNGRLVWEAPAWLMTMHLYAKQHS